MSERRQRNEERLAREQAENERRQAEYEKSFTDAHQVFFEHYRYAYGNPGMHSVIGAWLSEFADLDKTGSLPWRGTDELLDRLVEGETTILTVLNHVLADIAAGGAWGELVDDARESLDTQRAPRDEPEPTPDEDRRPVGRFPHPISLGPRSKGSLASEIARWQQERAAEGDRGSRK